MKKVGLLSLIIIISLTLSNTTIAIEEAIFNIRGNATQEVILEKLGAPKDATIPFSFKKGEQEIKVASANNNERVVSIDFSPPYSFTFNDKDLFEKIEIKDSGNRVNYALVISDPKKGRIWKLTPELKVSQFELISPWVSKSKMISLKEILKEMSQTKIQKNSKNKAEVKK